MLLSFIGMSNIGKTHWAARIAAARGCEHIECDALIERKLAPELAKGGFHGLRGIAQWMGLPAESQHKKNSALYIAAEQQVMHECLERLRAAPEQSAIFDTGGSVIYTDAVTQADLRALTRVIYFEASEAHADSLFRDYIANPKPTIWGDLYAPQEGETATQTLKRCYPILLRERARRYKELAHIVVPYEQHKARKADTAALIEELVAASS